MGIDGNKGALGVARNQVQRSWDPLGSTAGSAQLTSEWPSLSHRSLSLLQPSFSCTLVAGYLLGCSSWPSLE